MHQRFVMVQLQRNCTLTARHRTITFQDFPVAAWRDALQLRLPVHPINHLTTMADLHRAGRYDWKSGDVFTLTGQDPLSVREFVEKNAMAFAASPIS